MDEKKRVELHVVIDLIIRTTDKRILIEEFSKDPSLFGSILRDISNGMDSSNYHLLKKHTKNNKIIEQFVVEQARLILSQLPPYESTDDYKTQDGYHTTLTEEIVKSRLGIASKKFIYSVLTYIVILITASYLVASGLPFQSFGERGELAKDVEDKKEYRVETAIQTPIAEIPSTSAMEESSLTELVKESPLIEPERKEEVITTQPKDTPQHKEVKSEKTIVAQGVIEYSTQKGDNLWTVARRFKTSIKNIKLINDLKTDKLNIGDVLVVPQRIHKEKVVVEWQAKAKEEFPQSELLPEGIKHPEDINQTELEKIRLKLLNPSEAY